MACAGSTNFSSKNMEFYLKDFVQYLKIEYTLKKQRFNNLKDDVIQVQYSVEKMNTTLRTGKENLQSHSTRSRLKVRIEEVKQKMCGLMVEIGSIHTEDSEEHRFLQELLNHPSWRELNNCSNDLSEERQHLKAEISDVQSLHENNCREKQDLENIVNRAHHQLNKLEFKLRSFDKEQPSTGTSTQQKEDSSHPLAPVKQTGLSESRSSQGLTVRDTNQRN